MTTEYDPKTNQLTIKLSVNPKSTEKSSSGKTFIIATDGGKINLDGVEARCQINVYRSTGGAAKKARK